MSRKERKAEKLQAKADKAAAKVEAANSKPKKSKGKIIGIIVGICVILTAIAMIIPESDSSDITADIPAWADYTIDPSAPSSDTNAVLDAINHEENALLSEDAFNAYVNSEFSEEKAQYIHDNLTISYNVIAAAKVDKMYADNESRANIENALIDEGFSTEALTYVATNLDNKDFNEAAYNKAKEYREDDEMSFDDIAYELHAVDNFTEEEALYAVMNLPQ